MFELFIEQQQKQQVQQLLSYNEKTEPFGLALTPEDAQQLILCRYNSLKMQQRVEFGDGILPKLVETFCDSPYIQQNEYVEILEQLQDIFYMYKNEAQDKLTDDELISFMKEQFDGVCYGSLEYLSETCMERFARAIRAGYSNYMKTGCKSEYEQFSEEERWDKDLYLLALKDLII